MRVKAVVINTGPAGSRQVVLELSSAKVHSRFRAGQTWNVEFNTVAPDQVLEVQDCKVDVSAPSPS